MRFQEIIIKEKECVLSKRETGLIFMLLSRTFANDLLRMGFEDFESKGLCVIWQGIQKAGVKDPKYDKIKKEKDN